MHRLLSVFFLLVSSLSAQAQSGPGSSFGSGNWTGFHAGLQIDTLRGSGSFDFQTFDFEDRLPAVFLGYRHDFGGYVLGAEVDYQRGGITVAQTVPGCTGTRCGDAPRDDTRVENPVEVERLLRLGIEAGVDAGPALVYATAGWARIAFSGPPTADTSGSGTFYGLGVDYAVTDRITLGAELLRHRFDGLVFPGYSAEPVTFGFNIGIRF